MNTAPRINLTWLTNLYDPRRYDAYDWVMPLIGETRDHAWQTQQEWLADKIIGAPRATKEYSVAELQAMGVVGVYKYEAGA